MIETLSNRFISALYPVNILEMIAGVIALVYCAFKFSGSLLETLSNGLYPVNISAMIAGVIALVCCAFTLSEV